MLMSLFDEEKILKTHIASENRKAAAKATAKATAKTFIETCQELGESFSDTVARMTEKFNLSESDAEKEVTRYWK